MKRSIFLAILILVGYVVMPFQRTAEAASFNKNRLIDDSLFTDADSMTVAQIQSFLESEGSLLANWVDNVDMRRPSDNCIVHHATGMTAAEVIHQASTAWGAQVYGSNGCAVSGSYWSDASHSNYTLETISPKALLVTLQKEQSLISADGTYSTNPNAYKNPACCTSNEYKLARAMGYGVPDSGGINEKYLGFYNQVNWAAWQLRYNYERSGGNTAWDGVGYLTYSGPMIEGSFRRCGTCSPEAFDGYFPIDGTPLYMDNRATASLYFYTPHTYPGYHGNYNFVNFYTDWFGSTSAKDFAYAYAGHDKNPAMKQGFTNTVKLKLKNIGSQTWYDNSGLAGAPADAKAVVLTSDKPLSHGVDFSLYWDSASTPSKEFKKVYEADGVTPAADQDVAEPGQVAEFEIKFRAPNGKPSGSYQEYFTLKRDGIGGNRLYGNDIWIWAKVLKSIYTAEFAGQSSPDDVFDDQTETGYIQFKNTGNVDWFDKTSVPSGINPVTLATYAPINRESDLNRTWDSDNRPVVGQFSAVYEANGTTLSSNQHKVKPGQIVRFAIDFAATKSATTQNYKEHFRLIREGASQPLLGPTAWLYNDYDSGSFIANFVQQTASPTIAEGATATYKVRFKNEGTAKWYDASSVPEDMAPVTVATNDSINRMSDFGGTWAKKNRPVSGFSAVYNSNNATLSSNQHVVSPGQIAEFTITLKVPATYDAGKYREDFVLIRSGAKDFMFDSNAKFWTYVTVP